MAGDKEGEKEKEREGAPAGVSLSLSLYLYALNLHRAAGKCLSSDAVRRGECSLRMPGPAETGVKPG
jgi:hypothetical protein